MQLGTKFSLVVVSAFLLAWIRPPGPSVVVDDPSFARDLIENPQFAVLVIRIAEAKIVEGTKGTPPEGSCQVEEVLRGRSVDLGAYEYQLLSPRPAGDRGRQEWQAEPLHGPKSGDELIVFSYVGNRRVKPGSIIVLQGPQIYLSPETRKEVEENLGRDSPFQVPLFFVVVLSPVLGLLKRGGWLSIPVAFGAYLVYESVLSSYYDMRIDLLVLWPALAASVLVPLVASGLRKRFKSAA